MHVNSLVGFHFESSDRTSFGELSRRNDRDSSAQSAGFSHAIDVFPLVDMASLRHYIGSFELRKN